jgi:hypothetical protein
MWEGFQRRKEAVLLKHQTENDMQRLSFLPLLAVLACADKDTDDTAGTDDTATDDTGVEQDAAPGLQADVAMVEGAVGGELSVTFSITDEDPAGVTLEVSIDDESVASGAVSDTTWTATGGDYGTATLTAVATDAAGQSTTVTLPVEVYVQRTWSEPLLLQSSATMVLAADSGASPDGMTYLAAYGTAGTYIGLAMGVATDGTEGWLDSFVGQYDQIGRGTSYDETTGLTGFISQDRVGNNQVATLWGLNGGRAWSAQTSLVANGYTAPYFIDARDGQMVMGGPFEDTSAGLKGSWASVVDASTGEVVGTPFIFSAHHSADNAISSVDLTADGNILVGGYAQLDPETFEQLGHYNSFVGVYEAGNETPIWSDWILGEAASIVIHDAEELSDGSIVVMGITRTPMEHAIEGAGDAFIRLYDADGEVAWTHQYGSEYDSMFRRCVEGHDGSIYVVGSFGYNNGYDGHLEVMKFSLDGTEEWARSIEGDLSVRSRSIAFSGRDVIVTGIANGDVAELNLSHQGSWDSFAFLMDVDGNLR